MEGALLQVGQRGISLDEFSTIVAEAAAVVNQTPLWAVSDHPDDPAPLTPAMLLTLRQDNDVVHEEFTEKDLLRYGKLRHRRAQYLLQQFWVRWQQEYIHTLTARHKWKTRQSCLSTLDVVLMRQKDSPRNHWPIGVVTDVKVSKDGLVRSATIKLAPTSTNRARMLSRPISELVSLVPSENHNCNTTTP